MHFWNDYFSPIIMYAKTSNFQRYKLLSCTTRHIHSLTSFTRKKYLLLHLVGLGWLVTCYKSSLFVENLHLIVKIIYPLHTYTHAYTHIFTHTTHTYTHTHAYTHIFTHTHKHTHTQTHTHTSHTHRHTHIYIYIRTQMHTWRPYTIRTYQTSERSLSTTCRRATSSRALA